MLAWMRASLVALFAACLLLPAHAQEKWAPETFTLSNGLYVVVLPDHRAPVVTHIMWYRTGAVDEAPGKSGIAHFLEHLMFKATDKIKAGEYSKIVARNAGQDNAQTSWDYTNYFFRIAKDRLEPMMVLEADRMVGLKLEEREVDTEREAILNERGQNIDSDPGAVLSEKTFAALFPGHHYGVPIIGFRPEMEKLSQADAVDWYKRWYGPENAILVVAGDMTAAELKPMAERVYGGIPRKGDLNVRKLPDVTPLAKDVSLTHSDPKVRQEDWSRQWQGPKAGTPDSEALEVGLYVLGGGRTSRLQRELVEKQGIAASAYAYKYSLWGAGMVSVGAAPSPGASTEAVKKAVLAELDKFLKEGPTQVELERAKSSMVASTIYARDSQMGMAMWFGSELVIGRSVAEILSTNDRVKAVTAQQAVEAVKRYVEGKHFVDATLKRGR